MCKWRTTAILHRSFLMRVINKNARMKCAYLSRATVSVQQFFHFHGTAAKSFVFSLFLMSSDEVSFCMWTMMDCILLLSKQYTTDLWRNGKRFDFAATFQSRLRVRYVSDESVWSRHSNSFPALKCRAPASTIKRNVPFQPMAEHRACRSEDSSLAHLCMRAMPWHGMVWSGVPVQVAHVYGKCSIWREMFAACFYYFLSLKKCTRCEERGLRAH